MTTTASDDLILNTLLLTARRAADRARRKKKARRHFRDETFASFSRATCGTSSIDPLKFAPTLEQVDCRGCKRALELRRARLCGSRMT